MAQKVGDTLDVHLVDKADLKLSLAVATVLGNWHNVLRAISMASSECSRGQIQESLLIVI